MDAVDADPASPHHWAQHRLQEFDYHDTDHAYFLTIRGRPDTTPFTDARIAQEVIDCLNWLRANRDIRIYAYCLMPDHIHLLMRPTNPRWSVGDIVTSMKRFTTKKSWELGWKGTLWQRQFYDHIVRKSESGFRIAEYILANPVRAELVEASEEYKWSGTPDPM